MTGRPEGIGRGAADAALPGVCVVDFFLGRASRDAVPAQGELVADLLARDGVRVVRTTDKIGRLGRAVDIAGTLTRRRHEYDVVVVQAFGRRAFHYARLASWLAKQLDKRLVVVLQGGMLAHEWRSHPARLRPVLERADVLVAPSAHMAGTFRSSGLPIAVVPNCLDIDRYVFHHRARVLPRLFWVRAFHAQYNPQMAIETLARLVPRLPGATLTMGGPDRGEQAATEALAVRLGVRDRVRFVGYLTKQDLIDTAQAHDIHLHTNRIDNMPVTVMEHMALGVPVVATRVDGVPFLVADGETGLLVPSEAPEAAAAAIERLVREPGLAAALSAAARTHVATTLSWQAVGPLWRRALTASGAGPVRPRRDGRASPRAGASKAQPL